MCETYGLRHDGSFKTEIQYGLQKARALLVIGQPRNVFIVPRRNNVPVGVSSFGQVVDGKSI